LALAGRLRGARVVMHAHGGNIETWLTTRRTKAMMRLAMLPVDHVVAVWSAGERTLGRALGPDRTSLIDNGVDTDRFVPVEGAAHHPPRILYVGLLTPRKGVLDLIEASRLLRDEGVEHELLLVGGMPDEGPEAAAPVLAAAEGVARLLGTRPPEEMPAAYADAEVFCLPSWWEAMPLSVLEAMPASPWWPAMSGTCRGSSRPSAGPWSRPRTRAGSRTRCGCCCSIRSCAGTRGRRAGSGPSTPSRAPRRPWRSTACSTM
jgi:glycosyltransferase involved in cell wall biosynthesis